MNLEKQVITALIRLKKADKATLLREVQDEPAAKQTIGKLIDRGDFRVSLDWKLTPAPGLKPEE
jgi:hypothetical protein